MSNAGMRTAPGRRLGSGSPAQSLAAPWRGSPTARASEHRTPPTALAAARAASVTRPCWYPRPSRSPSPGATRGRSLGQRTTATQTQSSKRCGNLRNPSRSMRLRARSGFVPTRAWSVECRPARGNIAKRFHTVAAAAAAPMPPCIQFGGPSPISIAIMDVVLAPPTLVSGRRNLIHSLAPGHARLRRSFDIGRFHHGKCTFERRCPDTDG